MNSMRKKGTGLHRNTISYAGIIITALGSLLTFLATAVAVSGITSSPYLGIFSYLVFPTVILFGVAVILLGMRLESRRRKRTGSTEALPYPRLDLNDPVHRRKFAVISVMVFFTIILLCVVGYNGFLYTESTSFCGALCHVVMEPEYTAYQHSPHARVRCVDCHVGPGTSFYVKSKLSGAGMVSKTLLDSYDTPIPTPIHNLRPARETCEECHWPEKFFGAQLVQIPYFRYDEANTSDQISLIMKTGGGSSSFGQSEGIHWHMIIDNTITYAPLDDQQQVIPWFRVENRNGEARTYTSLDNELTPEELAALPKRTLDCIDCHNRPSHRFPPPDRSMDVALYNQVALRDLPWIKKVATEALEKPYPTTAAALAGIEKEIEEFYRTDYPDLYQERAADIELAVETTTAIYDRTTFPEMNVDWSTYPDNIGHRNWPGCYRCHDGRHVTPEGDVLTNECTVCHTIPTRSALKPLGAMAPASSEDWHPMALTGRHEEVLCTACHIPGSRPSPSCTSCHEHPADVPMAEMDCTDCHLEPGSLTPMESCTLCHDDLGGDHLTGAHPDADCMDCHRPHGWLVEGRETCSECHDAASFEDEHYAPDPCTDCHDFT